MDNSLFSTLIYRIIGKPERWHDDYIDVMHQILDETDSFDNPDNFSELEVGEQIISRLRGTNAALTAFNTLLNESRFKMIILDHALTPIYYNQSAKELYEELLDCSAPKDPPSLNIGLRNKLTPTIAKNAQIFQDGKPNTLVALDASDKQGDQLYLRSIYNSSSDQPETSNFHLLLMLDKAKKNELTPELISRYELTDKEQNVLIRLIHGQGIKQIAQESFVSENTIKTHLKALFRKTGSKSQADVVRLILTHESQILDSYFDPGSAFIDGNNTTCISDKSVTLSDGLDIFYCEYGPPDGDVVIFCHNGYGCRVTIPLGYEEVLTRLNKRLIIPDRPGIGMTPFAKDHPKKWQQRLNEFIDQLEIQQYEILGSVFGSVMALVHAVDADTRLTRVRLACPVLINEREDAQYMLGIFAPYVRLVRASSRFAKEIYELWLKSITMNLSTHYKSMLESSLGSKEREILTQRNQLDATFDLMINGFCEASRHSVKGIANESTFCLSPRKIDLNKITVPVDLWWGSEDNRISKEGVEALAEKLPNANLHIREGFSEHIYYCLFEEILSFS